MTLEQLRAVADAGGVEGVTLKGRDGMFLVEIDTRAGGVAVLSKARSAAPRLFGNMASALKLLLEIGITTGSFDASGWNPTEKALSKAARGRGDALREAHRSAAYNKWVATEIQAAVEDPRPSIPHGDVMRRLEGRLARLKAARGVGG
ncbi:hypothetical protein V5F41_16550 [Xanthobacter autotrophicus]|uniref:antitoxin PaaA2 family protein n=1 Tax=Xanthobacter autotrophicus TaxID=280 RepID=UPI0037279610